MPSPTALTQRGGHGPGWEKPGTMLGCLHAITKACGLCMAGICAGRGAWRAQCWAACMQSPRLPTGAWQVSAPEGEPGVEARGGPGSLSSPRGPAHPPLRSALHFQVRPALHSCWWQLGSWCWLSCRCRVCLGSTTALPGAQELHTSVARCFQGCQWCIASAHSVA